MSDLVIPPGKRTGCLPRRSKPGQWCPLADERIEVIPRDDWPNLIDNISLREMVWYDPLDQDGVGSCASESSTSSVLISRELSGQPQILLSPWFVYHHTSGGVDRGSGIDENLRFIRENGIAPMAVWPRSQGWRTKPSAEAYEAALSFRIEEFYDIQTINEVGSALLKGFAVVFGWKSHSCILTDLLSSTTALYLNSWGDWGDAGFGRIGLGEIDFRYGAWAVRAPLYTPSE